MLKYLDVLIGLAAVVLVSSMAVTVLTQAATSLWKSRGKALKQGITDLLRQIDPDFGEQLAGRLANAVLMHPLVRDGEKQLGTVIHREELTKILLELAADDGPQKLESDLRDKLNGALQKNGIEKPEGIIKNIRSTALDLELAHPGMANNVRHSIAILQHAKSDFVAKINGWFDQTIDRVSARFTTHTRWITVVNAALVAMFLQLDTVAVMNRLSVDDGMRAAVVAQAQNLKPDPQSQAAYRDMLGQTGLLWIPSSGSDWFAHWGWSHLPGIAVSMLLLNLGAPFWFSVLKNLLQLRSLVAQKDDEQRKDRQTQATGSAVAT
ncbi:MAG: hypothetical protein JO022_06880 [Acidobacteriaceae bacterium]|nr:hypothetical protein [Acidobacteriaceae bacterium]